MNQYNTIHCREFPYPVAIIQWVNKQNQDNLDPVEIVAITTIVSGEQILYYRHIPRDMSRVI